MSRYIDADLVHEKYDKYANDNVGGRGNGKTLAQFLVWIDEQPTADVVSKEKYDELNDRYHRLLESANILADAVRDYERREDDKGKSD